MSSFCEEIRSCLEAYTSIQNHIAHTMNIICFNKLLLMTKQSAMQRPEHMHLASTHNEHTTAVCSIRKKHHLQPAKAYEHEQLDNL